MLQPIIISPGQKDQSKIASGSSFVIHEWRGSGPDYLHVHYEDDEAWYVLEGTLTFRFSDRSIQAPKGTMVFAPAGVAHTYSADSDSRYLIILTPRLEALIAELQAAPYSSHASIMKKYKSEIVT